MARSKAGSWETREEAAATSQAGEDGGRKGGNKNVDQNVFGSRVNRTSDGWDVRGQGTGARTCSVGFGPSTCLVAGAGAPSPELRLEAGAGLGRRRDAPVPAAAAPCCYGNPKPGEVLSEWTGFWEGLTVEKA